METIRGFSHLSLLKLISYLVMGDEVGFPKVDVHRACGFLLLLVSHEWLVVANCIALGIQVGRTMLGVDSGWVQSQFGAVEIELANQLINIVTSHR